MEIILTKLHRKSTSEDNEMITAKLLADIVTMNPRKTGKSGFVSYWIYLNRPKYGSQNTNDSHFKKEDLHNGHVIVEKSKECRFDIKYFATDADSKINQLRSNFYYYLQNYIGTFEQKIYKMPEYGREFLISVLLHLLKALRRKL